MLKRLSKGADVAWLSKKNVIEMKFINMNNITNIFMKFMHYITLIFIENSVYCTHLSHPSENMH